MDDCRLSSRIGCPVPIGKCINMAYTPVDRRCYRCGGPSGFLPTCNSCLQTEMLTKLTTPPSTPKAPRVPRYTGSETEGLIPFILELAMYYVGFCWLWWMSKLFFTLLGYFFLGHDPWPTWYWIGSDWF